MSDGATRDVTAEAVWASNSVILVISAPGLVAGGPYTGQVMLTASVGGLSSTKEVIVVPDGTYRLSGVVSDPVTPAGPIPMAEIDAIDAAGRRLTGYTGNDGRYALFGLSGEVWVRIAKTGYQPYSERLVVDDHRTLNVELAIVVPLPNLGGIYTLTIAAADVCGGALPGEAMSRRYSAAVTQVGPSVTMALSDATFVAVAGYGLVVSQSMTLAGVATPTEIRFTLGALGCFGYYYGCGPTIFEQLAPSRFFMPSGRVVVPITPAALAGELDGVIEVQIGSSPGQFNREASCRSSRHQFVLTR
jgi:hypothetical protein